MSSIQPPPSGSLCLDLINTQWRPHGGLQDALETPADTQIWLTTHELWRADLDLGSV